MCGIAEGEASKARLAFKARLRLHVYMDDGVQSHHSVSGKDDGLVEVLITGNSSPITALICDYLWGFEGYSTSDNHQDFLTRCLHTKTIVETIPALVAWNVPSSGVHNDSSITEIKTPDASLRPLEF